MKCLGQKKMQKLGRTLKIIVHLGENKICLRPDFVTKAILHILNGCG